MPNPSPNIPKPPPNPVPSWPELRVYDDEGRLWWRDEDGRTWSTYAYTYLVNWANAHERRVVFGHKAPDA